MQFESAVTETYQKAFVGSPIENGATIIQFDLRQLDFQRLLGTTSPICWRQDVYHVDIHELSTFHNPIKYRFIVAQGSYLYDKQQRVYFTQDIQGVSTSQHMSKSIIRLCCYLAVVCGVSLRQPAVHQRRRKSPCGSLGSHVQGVTAIRSLEMALPPGL